MQPMNSNFNCHALASTTNLNPSSPVMNGILEKLSMASQQNIMTGCHLQPQLLEIWNNILQKADDAGKLQELDEEVLSRIEDSKLFAAVSVYSLFSKVFSSTESIMACFLKYATTFKANYYSEQEFIKIVQSFSKFLVYLERVQLPLDMDLFRCHDQNGGEWIERCIATLQHSQYAQEQIEIWKYLPSLQETQQIREKNQYLFHPLNLQITSTKKSISTLKTAQSMRNVSLVSQCSLLATGNHRLSAKEYLEVIELLESSLYQDVYSDTDKAHLLKMIVQMTSHASNKGSGEAFIYWCKTIKETLGEFVFCSITNPNSYHAGCSLQETIQLIQKLLELEEDIEEIFPILSDFSSQKLSLSLCMQKLDQAKAEIYRRKYPEKDLQEVINAYSSTEYPIAQSELTAIIEDYQEIARLGLGLQNLNLQQLAERAMTIRESCSHQSISKQDKLLLIAIGREAIRFKFGIYPYNTQILALLGMLNYPSSLKGRIAQAKTGEGKSTLVALLAFYLAGQGKTVDIISSSSYLAKRDQEKYQNFFEVFGVTTSHICNRNPVQKDFQGQILYGTNTDFEFALMWDYLHQRGLRKTEVKGKMVPRKFDSVIVDEVDNLFIDTANNSARLAISIEKTQSWIFKPILDFVTECREGIKAFGLCNNSSGMVTSDIAQGIICYLKKSLGKGKSQEILSYIESIEETQWAKWISYAYQALYQKELNKDYIIKPKDKDDPDSAGSGNSIVIVDADNTGRLQEGTRWGGGLHEFLEAKHNLAIKQGNVVSASMCHPVFFSYYSQIYGVTGTMGTDIERSEVQEIYQVDSFDVPPHKKNLRRDLIPKVLDSQEELYDTLITEIKDFQSYGRPILMLFETIQDSEDFSAHLHENQIKHQILNERQKEHEDFILTRAGEPGIITLATNTAGRGTDIILHPVSKENGGLHVVFGFYPSNSRVEAQGIGRAGRQGQPGSSRLIIYTENLGIFSILEEAQKLKILQETRKTQNLNSSKQRMIRCGIERDKHFFLQTFFDRLENWYATINEKFFLEIEESWKKRIEESGAVIKDKLSIENADRHMEALYKIFSSQSSILQESSWKTFFEIIKSILAEKLEKDWGALFYDKLDDLHETLSSSNNPETLSQSYKVSINELYNATRSNWEQYLLEPKKGFLRYMEEITGVSCDS